MRSALLSPALLFTLGLSRSAGAQGQAQQTQQAQQAQQDQKDQIFQMFADELGRPGGLTADEVARRAAAVSPAVRARAADAAGAEAAVAEARAGYLPRVQGQARRSRLSTLVAPSLGNLVIAPPGTPPGPLPAGTELLSAPVAFPQRQDQTVLQASLTIPLSDYLLRVTPAKAAAERGARAAAEGERGTLLRTAADARVAFYQWVRARLGARVARQALAQAQQHLVDARAARDAGSASTADVLRVESQVAGAELGATRADNLERLGAEQLRTAMHDDSHTMYVIGDDLSELPAAGSPGHLEDLVGEAARARAEVRGLDEAAAAARQQVKLARAAAFPRLDAVAAALYANPNPRAFPQEDRYQGTWDAGLVLTWTPSDLPATLAAVRGAEARVRQLEARRAELLDGVRLEITQAAQALDEATVALRTTARGLVAAEESYRVRRLLFQNGKATSVEQTDAELELTRARLDALDARVAQRIAQVLLDHALGRDATAAR